MNKFVDLIQSVAKDTDDCIIIGIEDCSQVFYRTIVKMKLLFKRKM
jgi:hypothetical protein